MVLKPQRITGLQSLRRAFEPDRLMVHDHHSHLHTIELCRSKSPRLNPLSKQTADELPVCLLRRRNRPLILLHRTHAHPPGQHHRRDMALQLCDESRLGSEKAGSSQTDRQHPVQEQTGLSVYDKLIFPCVELSMGRGGVPEAE